MALNSVQPVLFHFNCLCAYRGADAGFQGNYSFVKNEFATCGSSSSLSSGAHREETVNVDVYGADYTAPSD